VNSSFKDYWLKSKSKKKKTLENNNT
jgi:hypothetical protein